MVTPVFDFRKTAFDGFKEWRLTNKPDAIVTVHQEVEDWLEALRLRVPRDLGLIHLDREEGMTHWAGMNQNNYRVGASATDMVVGALHRNELGVPEFPRSSMMQSNWVEGASVALQNSKKPRAKRSLSQTK